MNVRIRNLVFLLLALVLLLAALSLFAGFEASKSRVSSVASVTTTPSYPPPLTPEIKAQLAASKGFQYLISYTDRGFEPATLTIKKGETVRFANNSSEGLWIAAGGAKLYPSIQNGCGSSALDSCRPIARGEFWEFTFTETGIWSYRNNIDTAMSGTIRVK